MKKIIQLSFVLMVLTTSFSCNAQTSKKASQDSASNKASQDSASNKVEAYYFHFNARCVTCKTVESEAKADIQSLYYGAVSFKAINLDDESSKAIAEKLKITGQTLLIVKGDKRIILTNEGFMYAMNNPAKFKSIIKEKVDGLLKL